MAATILSKNVLETEGATANVDEKMCSGCGTCVKMCPYSAIEKNEMGVARVNEVICKGCGLCGASCPEKAISMHHFTDEQVVAQALAALGRTVE